MKTGGKIVATLVSVLLVAGVVFGVLFAVNRNGKCNENQNTSTSTSMKAVEAVCAPAAYKDVCARIMGPVASNSSATPKDFLLAALQATIEEVKKSLEVAGEVRVNKDADPYNHLAVEECKELLQDAVEELQASISMVGDSEMHTLGDRVNELLNWLTAVYGYQTSCVNEVRQPEYKSVLEKGMINATQLTHNAVNIIADVTGILQGFNIEVNVGSNPPTAGRRLLEVQEVGHDGYPTWFPVADRKLLQAHGQGLVKPNAIVAKDGSGQFKTVKAAVDSYPKGFNGRYVIYVKAGVYDEIVTVDKAKPNVYIYGDGPGKTIITGKLNCAFTTLTTSATATFTAIGKGFIARSMTFRNDIGPAGHQAVAFRSQSDMTAVFDCSIEGYQDTLYYHSLRQFYRNCMISGTIDFIFGKGTAVIQNSLIVARKPAPNQFNTITADGNELDRGIGGLVLQNCQIVADRDLFPVRSQVRSYLARPWQSLSTLVVMQSEIGDFIHPEGYFPMENPKTKAKHELTCRFMEFANRGPGANTAGRSKLFKNFRVIGPREAARYTAGPLLTGNLWLKDTGAPYILGL